MKDPMKSPAIILMLILLTASPAAAFREAAPRRMTRFNEQCPAAELCPLLDQAYTRCRSSGKAAVCSVFVDIFSRLSRRYDCQRRADNTDTGDFIVPAFWMCDTGKSWSYLELLSNLPFEDARAFFASPAFRSLLRGEQAAAYIDQSFLLEEQRTFNK